MLLLTLLEWGSWYVKPSSSTYARVTA